MAGSQLIAWGDTDQGKRTNNEDAFLSEKIGHHTRLLAVADGMGGGVAGEVASATVIDELLRSVTADINEDTGPHELSGILRNAYSRVQEKVQEVIRQRPDLEGMGTTLTVLLVHKQDYVFGNLGDSRLYQILPDEIRQLTRDHSHIQELIDKGETPDEAYVARYSNLITKCIGGNTEEPDIEPGGNGYHTMVPGTAFLLCSDGLITKPSEEENKRLIHQVYLAGSDIKQVPRNLINLADNEGSRDNITAVALEYGFPRKRSVAGLLGRSKLPAYRIVFISLAVILAIIAAVFLAQYGLRSVVPGNGEQEAPEHEAAPWRGRFTEVDEYTSRDLIRWNPYPGKGELKEIRIIQFGDATGSTQLITDPDNKGKTPVSSLMTASFKNDTTLKIRIEAVLLNDSIIRGDTALIKIRNIE